MEEGVEKRFDVSSLMSDRSASSVVGLALIQPSVILPRKWVKLPNIANIAKNEGLNFISSLEKANK